MSTNPVVESISTNAGMIGQIAYTATVRYEGEPVRYVAFASNRHGGPVVMVDDTFGQTFVSDPERFGRFSPRWVRRFFGEDV
jgi:hypothetical protein